MSSVSDAQEDLKPQFSPDELQLINTELDGKSPQDILRWAVDHVEGLFQTTAFGL
jgi:phosphoadenosine phosphosulfate reductase